MAFGVSQAQIRTIVQQVTDDIKNQTDKLAGEKPGESSVGPVNWQSGTGTSGEPGQDLVSIGVAGNLKKLHSLIVNIGALTATASITIKLFALVNASWTKLYNESFVVGTDPSGVWAVNGTLEISGVLRVECQSNNAGDNGGFISYKYDLEDM
ncbi:hypothetical protein ES703_68214 [subsurface metagenome]